MEFFNRKVERKKRLQNDPRGGRGGLKSTPPRLRNQDNASGLAKDISTEGLGAKKVERCKPYRYLTIIDQD